MTDDEAVALAVALRRAKSAVSEGEHLLRTRCPHARMVRRLETARDTRGCYDGTVAYAECPTCGWTIR